MHKIKTDYVLPTVVRDWRPGFPDAIMKAAGRNLTIVIDGAEFRRCLSYISMKTELPVLSMIFYT